MDPFLASDTAREKIVDVNAYLSAALRTSDNPTVSEALESIIQSVGFKTRLGDYKQEVCGGRVRYPIFVDLANYAIAQMVDKGIATNEHKLILCVNDSARVLGSLATRRPDIVGAMTGAVEFRCRNEKGKGKGTDAEDEESGVSELTRRAPNPAFAWSELLTFIEPKMVEPDLSTKQQANPLIQTSKNQSLVALTSGSQSISLGVVPLRRSSRLASGSRASSSHHANQIATSPFISNKRPLPHGGHDDAPLAKKAKIIQKDHGTRCASYTLEMFNRGGIRTHVIRAFIINDELQLCLYTRSGSCPMHPFSIIFEPLTFIRTLLAFSTLSISQWGMFDKVIPRTLSTPKLPSPDVSPTTPDCEMYVGQILTLDGIEYDVLGILAFSRGLASRSTSVLRVRSRHPKFAARNQVMKLSSPALSLSTENAKVIRSAREEHVWVSRRLPNILGYGEVVSDFSFGEPFDDQNFEAKNFRYTIAEELFPITDLTNPCELAKAFKDIILCHQWLAVNAKIVHGDISVNNLMCRIVDGKGYGVLNDFDLAYFIGAENKKPSSKQRTGTKPFIAMDLLHPVVQIDCDLLHVRCDLESFMYVFAWVVCRFQDKEEIANPPLKDWTEGPLEHVRMTKLDWLSFWTDLTPQYNPLIMILYYLRRHVRNGVHVKARALDYTRLKMKRKGLDKLTSPSGQPFDYLTLDGNITYDKFISAFEHIH